MEYYHARRDASVVELVCRQSDDALDNALLDEVTADCTLSIAAEKHAIWLDASPFGRVLEGAEVVQQVVVITLLGGRDALPR